MWWVMHGNIHLSSLSASSGMSCMMAIVSRSTSLPKMIRTACHCIASSWSRRSAVILECQTAHAYSVTVRINYLCSYSHRNLMGIGTQICQNSHQSTRCECNPTCVVEWHLFIVNNIILSWVSEAETVECLNFEHLSSLDYSLINVVH